MAQMVRCLQASLPKFESPALIHKPVVVAHAYNCNNGLGTEAGGSLDLNGQSSQLVRERPCLYNYGGEWTTGKAHLTQTHGFHVHMRTHSPMHVCAHSYKAHMQVENKWYKRTEMRTIGKRSLNHRWLLHPWVQDGPCIKQTGKFLLVTVYPQQWIPQPLRGPALCIT